MVLHVIGAGFGRTGTSSLQRALEVLGFGPCYHITELFAHPEHAVPFEAAHEGNEVDWDSLFDGYGSAVDFPTSFFYRELSEKYPNAKIILTVRPSAEWYESVEQTLWQLSLLKQSTSNSEEDKLEQLIDSMSWNGLFKGRFHDKDFAISVLESHISAVKQTIASNRLLEFNIRDGWNPLCQFLGVPVPETPFPHCNPRRVIVKEVEELRQSVGQK